VDTRTKIISAESVAGLARSGAYLVSGAFDPLVAGLAEQLVAFKREASQEGRVLVVLIRSAQNPILPAHARAELVAALEVVDYVCDEEWEGEPAVRLEQEHAQRLRELIAHVHARQNAAVSKSGPPDGRSQN
jgi:hypothetical protein